MRREIRRVDPRTIKLLDLNARFMKYETYQQLVRNVRRDGALTSVPFCWTTPEGRLEVLSGNHRVQAAIDADLDEIDVMVTDEPLTYQQRVGIQLSHNAIDGEDDPAVLKQLYDSLDDTDWRAYAGLDDKTLDLLQQVDVGSLADVDLDYATVQIVFLPPELQSVREVLDDAKKATPSDERWAAAMREHDRLLDALAETRDSYNIGNIATALALILGVYEKHRDELKDGFLDPATGEALHKGWSPLNVIFGRGTIPAQAAAVVVRAVEAMIGREEIAHDKPWQALEYWAADYLAGPQDQSALRDLPTVTDVQHLGELGNNKGGRA